MLSAMSKEAPALTVGLAVDKLKEQVVAAATGPEKIIALPINIETTIPILNNFIFIYLPPPYLTTVSDMFFLYCELNFFHILAVPYLPFSFLSF
jgi:hypothetical protein